jgi:hypothetical protein
MRAAEKLEGWQQVADGLERMLKADLWELGIATQHDLWGMFGVIQGRIAWLEGGGT